MEPRYYTPREVADLMRVSPTTVMKLIHEGGIYAVRVSERIYRIPVGAVRRLQTGDQQTYEPTEESVDALPPLGEPVELSEADAVSA